MNNYDRSKPVKHTNREKVASNSLILAPLKQVKGQDIPQESAR